MPLIHLVYTSVSDTASCFGFQPVQQLITIISSPFKSKATVSEWVQILKWPDTFSLNVTTCGAAGAFGFNYRWGWHRATLGFTAATGQRLKGECSFNTSLMVIPRMLVSKRVVQMDTRLFSLNLRELNHGLLQFLEVSCCLIPILYYSFAEGIIWQMGPFWCRSLDSMCFRKPKCFWWDVNVWESAGKHIWSKRCSKSF